MKRLALFVFFYIFLLAPSLVFAASLSSIPNARTVTVGNTISVPITVSSLDKALNALSGTLSFPADLLHVISISKAGSIVSLWVQEPSFSNDSGTVQFEGVVPNPGFTGLGGKVLTVTFLAVAPGNAEIIVKNGQVLANDGNGTNILTSAMPGSITVTAASAPSPTPASLPAVRVTSSSHPDQEATYRETHVILDWTNHAGTSAVKIGYNKYRDTPGVVVYSPAISHKEIDLEDGTWYFHVQEKTSDGWGPLATYAIRIDSTLPPEVLPVEATTIPVIASQVEPPSPSPRTFLIFAIPLIAVALALLIFGWELARSFATPRPAARRIRTAVHHEFNDLKDAMANEIRALERARDKRDLTVAEERLINRLNKIIDRYERSVEDIVDDTP